MKNVVKNVVLNEVKKELNKKEMGNVFINICKYFNKNTNLIKKYSNNNWWDYIDFFWSDIL